MNKLFNLSVSAVILLSGNVGVAFAQRVMSQTVTVTTIAGDGIADFRDANSYNAEFHSPTGVALDPSGYIYVADSQNNRIRKIDAAGNVTTYAGTGGTGSNNGYRTSAQFSAPWGIAVDASYNVYVGDWYNHLIRKIDPTGMVTTLAGTGAAGFADGAGTTAQFNRPQGVAVDGSGNVYVADASNHKIRKITPSGFVSTLAGSDSGFADGSAASAKFKFPSGVAADAAGNVFVGDLSNNRVRKITASGMVSTFAGTGAVGHIDGNGLNARFALPIGVALDNAGNLFVADAYNNIIRKISPTGFVSTLAGSGDAWYSDGTGTTATFYQPVGLVVDPYGNVYVADMINQRIRKVTVTPNSVTPAVSQSLQLIPNPAVAGVHIKGLQTVESVYIFNALGQQVLFVEADSNTEINLQPLSPGIYEVRVGLNRFRLVKTD